MSRKCRHVIHKTDDEPSFAGSQNLKLSTCIAGLVVTTGLLMAAHRSMAQETPDTQEPEWTDNGTDAGLWHGQMTLWIVLPFMSGDASVAGSSVNLELNPGDIFDAADTVIGGQGQLEVWYDNRFGLVVESMGSLIEAEQTISRSPVLPAIPAAGVKVNLQWELVIVDIEGAYRIHEGPLGDSGMKWRLDGTAGLRYTHFKQEAELAGLGGLGLSGTVGGTEDWVDPIIGARIGVEINDRWSCGVRGNVGGFGIGNASTLSWRVAAGFGYKINERLTLKAGYQVYGLDYDNDEVGRGQIGFDGLIHGPVVGLTFNF